jgi:integrase
MNNMQNEKQKRRARRGRGEGSIYQRADGYWCANVSAGYSDTGKRRRKTIYAATKKEVQDKLRVTATEVAAGAPVETQKLTLGEFLDRWLNSIKQSVAPSTHDRYECTVKKQLKPFIGGVRLSRLEPIHVEQLYATLHNTGCSPRGIQLAGVTLVAALQYAFELRLVAYNAARGIKKPLVPKPEMKCWDAASVGMFLKATKADRLHAMYVLALSAGMRQGELFGLQWSDVNFTSGCLTVQRSLEELCGKQRPKSTKSGKGRRIDLPSFALDVLRDHRAAMLAEGNIKGPVFCDCDGGWLRKSNVCRRSFGPMMVAAGVPRIRFHDMRHTHATLLLAAGENVKVVSERLGHASIKITLDTYAHVLPSMQKGAADKLQKLLG